MEEKTEKIKIGELLVREGYVTFKQLEDALAEQARAKEYVPLGEVCVRLRFISRLELRQILRKYQKNIYLGEIMVNVGLVTQEQIDEALEIQKVEGKRLGKILVENGFVTEEHLVNTLSTQLGIPKIAPSPGLIDRKLLEGVNRNFLLKNECVPAFKEDNTLTVIMSDPLSEDTAQTLKNMFKCQIEPAIATSEDILKTIRLIYGDLKTIIKTAEEEAAPFKGFVIGDTDLAMQPTDDVVGILNFIISNAIMEGATDIHVEPQENRLRVRYRVDGLLRHKTDLPLYMASNLFNRIKAAAGMDIADRRKNQDGRISAQIMKKDYDLRISTYYSILGESLTIRVLPRQLVMIDIEMLGFSPANLIHLKRILHMPSGILLTTGPNGTGKTTTLYAATNYLIGMDKKVITIEDPVEYKIEGLVQGQISERTGTTYTSFIRSMLRQDPDVIMVGEVRDQVSADAVIEAALTGTKVLTSMHTDDAIGALVRLSEMGKENFLVSSTGMSVISQRLVRLLCPYCKEPFMPGDNILSFFGSIRPFDTEKYTFYAQRGCNECDNTGFKGRTAIHEILTVNNDIRDAIFSKTPFSRIRPVARRTSGFLSMMEDGFYKATKGITSLEEIARMAVYAETDYQMPRSSEEVVALCEVQESVED